MRDLQGSALRGRRHDEDGTATIELEGELDMGTVFDFETWLSEVLKDTDSVVVDLGGLTFLDSTGVGALIAAGREAREHGADFRLRPGPPAVQRVFEVAGILNDLRWEE